MSELFSVRVTRTDGTSFDATVSNLTHSSLFLMTPEALHFRDRLSVMLFDRAIEGEVAFVVREPRLGGVFTFTASKGVKDMIVQQIDRVEAFTLELSGLIPVGGGHDRVEVTRPIPTPLSAKLRAQAKSYEIETIEELRIDTETLIPPTEAELREDLYQRPPLLKKKGPPPPPAKTKL